MWLLTIGSKLNEAKLGSTVEDREVCSGLSDSGGDAKVKETRKVGGAGKRIMTQFPPDLFSCSRFLNSADPTISEPGTD